VAPKTRGCLVAFPANVLHQVTPIEAGAAGVVVWAVDGVSLTPHGAGRPKPVSLGNEVCSYRGLRVLFSCWLPLAVLAAPKQEAPKDWEVTLGAGAGMRPTFEAADRYTVRAAAGPSSHWRDTISLARGRLERYWHRKRFRIGAGLTFDAAARTIAAAGFRKSGGRPPQRDWARSTPPWACGALGLTIAWARSISDLSATNLPAGK